MNGNNRKTNLINFLYNSIITKKLIKNFMKHGKQNAAYKIIFKTFKGLKNQINKNPNLLLHISIYQQKLPIELVSVKKSGKVYKLPSVVNIDRQFKTILKLLSTVTKKNKKTTSFEILKKEINDSIDIKKKTLVQKQLDSICKIAIDNQPFMHFRWLGKQKLRLKKRKKSILKIKI